MATALISWKKSFSLVLRDLLKVVARKVDIDVEITVVKDCLCTMRAIWPLLLKVLKKQLRDLLDSLNWLPATIENSLHNGGLLKWRSKVPKLW